MATKLAHRIDIPESGDPPHLLDTLETTGDSTLPKGRETLAKRTRQKASTFENTKRLAALHSPLEDKYQDSQSCGKVMLQEGDKFHTMTCKRKWCRRCCHIRTSKLIRGYEHILQDFPDPHFVVLTMKTHQGRELKSMIDKMNASFRRANQNIKKTHGIQIHGIRTWECTYTKDGLYHPHFNVIVDTREGAELLKSYWMAYWTKTQGAMAVNEKAQFIRPISTVKGLLEVFKYTTKMAVPEGSPMIAQDWIYQCTERRRLAQAFGKVSKAKVDAMTDTHTDICEGETRTEIWVWENDVRHYVSYSGETLISDREMEIYLAEKAARKKTTENHHDNARYKPK